MERIAVRSQDIAIVGYDAQAKTLEITFRRGGVYEYSEVPAEVHRNLMEAASIGTYFGRKIKDKYRSAKIQ